MIQGRENQSDHGMRVSPPCVQALANPLAVILSCDLGDQNGGLVDRLGTDLPVHLY